MHSAFLEIIQMSALMLFFKVFIANAKQPLEGATTLHLAVKGLFVSIYL